jgi:N-acetylmuramoyl-L-alanine amidase
MIFMGSQMNLLRDTGPVFRRMGLAFAASLLAAGLGACGSHALRGRAAAVHFPYPPLSEVSYSPTRVPGRPLAGRVVGVDPGHNGANGSHLGVIDAPIWNGRETEACNTTGTETDAGYTEALFNWRVAQFLVADLRAEGARVVLTRHSNTGVGPCVNRRAAIFNQAHVDVGVAIHADGGPASGHGFAILTPVADQINHRVIGASDRFARDLRTAFAVHTGMSYSTYDGVAALQPRDNLAGENLTRVPYVLIECGNMRNAGDAARETSAAWQRRAAAGIAAGITAFLR